jgi:hypothetical protein
MLNRVMPRVLLFAVALLSFWAASVTPSSAQTETALRCPQDADVLSVDGVGTIYASGGYDLGEPVSTFFEACLERDGWRITFPKLTVTTGEQPNTPPTLDADSATLETNGARGSIAQISGSIEDLNFTAAKLDLTAAYALEGLPRGDYRVSAARGRFRGERLNLEEVIVDRLRSGAVIERFAAARLALVGNRGTLEGVRYGNATFAVNASSAQLGENGLGLGVLQGLIGRNSSGSELTFTARGALLLPNGAIQLQGATVRFLGIGIGLGDVVYDPACPPEFPITFNPGSGLTIGIDNARITCDGGARVSLIAHDIFATATRGYTAFLALSQGVSTLFVGQRRSETARLEYNVQPEIGLGGGFTADTGTNIEGTLQTERFAEGRLGLFGRLDAGPLTLRPRLEVGAAAQQRSANPDAFLGYARGTLEASTAVALGAFSVAGGLGSRFTLYSDARTAADVIARASVALSVGGFSALTGVRYAQQLVSSPITRHNVTNLTRLDVVARFAPGTPPPALGYAGLQLQSPLAGLTMEYDLRVGAFVVQRVDLGLGVAVYDGVVLTDHFGNPFQTPAFAMRLSTSYDFVPQTGEVGALVSFYGTALVYDLGAYVALPSTALRFTISFRLR